jgi:hypothetical protein
VEIHRGDTDMGNWILNLPKKDRNAVSEVWYSVYDAVNSALLDSAASSEIQAAQKAVAENAANAAAILFYENK